MRENDSTVPFCLEYFNVLAFYELGSETTDHAFARIINALISAINAHKHLPQYLVIIPDKDILLDLVQKLDDLNNLAKITADVTRWMVGQLNIVTCRARVQLLEAKPGVVSRTMTLIFVKMIKRVGSFTESSPMHKATAFWAKFNDTLNDAVAKVEQRILTVNSCCTYDHFDHKGNLSLKGKKAFWLEIDNLLERFDKNKVKLLPNPKNPPRISSQIHDVSWQGGNTSSSKYYNHPHCHRTIDYWNY